MATKFKAFEKSGKDKEPKGMKEGSKKEEALDMKQMKTGGGMKTPNPGKKGLPAFMVGKKGGK